MVSLTLQDWKVGKHLMGHVRKYEKDPVIKSEPLDLNEFKFQHVKVDVIPNKTGWGRFKISLPQSFRQLYARDIVFGSDWASILNDFDKQPLDLKTIYRHNIMVSHHPCSSLLVLVSSRSWLQVRPSIAASDCCDASTCGGTKETNTGSMGG